MPDILLLQPQTISHNSICMFKNKELKYRRDEELCRIPMRKKKKYTELVTTTVRVLKLHPKVRTILKSIWDMHTCFTECLTTRSSSPESESVWCFTSVVNVSLSLVSLLLLRLHRCYLPCCALCGMSPLRFRCLDRVMNRRRRSGCSARKL